MRYTESKLSRIGELLMKDIDKDTVDMVPNYDESTTEPSIISGYFPGLLANGTYGIAVGMSSSFAPHCVKDVYTALDFILDRVIAGQDFNIEELIDIIKAPDFPTGGIIVNPEEVRRSYITGKGRVIVRSKYEIEDLGRGKEAIIITELPYKVIKSKLILKIADMSKDSLPEIQEVRDESNREGIRIVIELRRNTNAQYVINKLLKYTDLQSNVSLIHTALVDGKPKLNLTLSDLLYEFLKHAIEFTKRRVKFDLKKASARFHVVSAIVKAMEDLDKTIKVVKSATSYKDAIEKLKAEFDYDETQAKAVAEIKLWSLSSEGATKYKKEHEDLAVEIKSYNDILSSQIGILGETKIQLSNVATMFKNDKRYTEIDGSAETIQDERELIKNEDIVVMLTHNKLVKAVKTSDYNSQKRAGKGSNNNTREDDFVEQIYSLQTHDDLILATNRGKIVILPAYKIPIVSKNSVGKYINNFVNLEEGEEIISILPMSHNNENTEGINLLLVAKSSKAKRLSLNDLPKTKSGAMAIKFQDENDELIACTFIKDTESIFVVTQKGMAARIDVNKIRVMGRSSLGVGLVKFKYDDDKIISVLPVAKEDNIFIISENGFGKRTAVSEHTIKSRGIQGGKCYKVTKKTGDVVGAIKVVDGETLFVVTKEGMIIRTPINNISVLGKNASGVKILNLKEGDSIATISNAPDDTGETTEELEE